MQPQGCLLNGKWALVFRKDPKSLNRSPQVYMDKWKVSSNGIPLTFINRRKVNFQAAIETWNELIEHGWMQTDFQSQYVA